MTRVSNGLRIFLLGLLLLVILEVLFRLPSKILNRLTKMLTIKSVAFDIYQILISSGFDKLTAEYITAQAAHETGNFTSELFNKHNNAFGFKYYEHQNLKVVPIQAKEGVFASYQSIKDSVSDYIANYKYWNYEHKTELINFVKQLKEKNYFEADEESYFNGINYFHKKYFGTQTAGI